ncbi:amidohydrolase [Aeoliella sp.]|uniref:amidohydrolase n=1 Tax=Aeoliella sp. TaxID=2795800 RepID=UPI003CCC2058
MPHHSVTARFVAACLAVLSFSVATSASDVPADLVVLDAVVLTMDAETPEAEALAVRDGRFVAVGSGEAVRPLIGPKTKVLHAHGKVLVPGFNDAHIHPSPMFDELSPLGKVPCGPNDVGSIDELVARMQKKAAVTPAGKWVRGSRYEDTKLGRYLTRDDLDRVSTSHPVYVSHSSGHLSSVNSLALDQAGITDQTPDPRGGAFDRDDDGRPNGVCRESAQSKVLGAGPSTPSPSKSEWIEGIQRRFREYSKCGITSIQHAGTSPTTLRKYALLQAQEQRVRISVMLRRKYLDELEQMVAESGRGNEWLRIGAIKTYHGNSLSGRTCWLYEPYDGRPGYYGIPPAASQETLNRRVLEIHSAGMQACIHSNGDREIDMVLNAYEAALEAEPRANHRHRIEHASICNQEILDRVKRLGVVLAPHSYVWEHGDKMEAYGPQRWPWMHANGTAMRMEIPVAGNSDSPVSAAVPLLRIQSMVTRTSKEGKVYGREQRVPVEQAIYAWTMGSAYASFEEDIKGSLTVGKLADFVMLSDDPRTVAPETIKDIEVELTAVGGEVVYRSASLAD